MPRTPGAAAMKTVNSILLPLLDLTPDFAITLEVGQRQRVPVSLSVLPLQPISNVILSLG